MSAEVARFVMKCRRTVLLALPALLAPLAPTALAQDYPARTVRIVVPFPAGGSTDVLSRLVAQRLNQVHGSKFVVENRPGATGTIAGAFVARSAPDGYALLMHSSSSYLAGFIYTKLPYDAAQAFTPVIRCSISGLVLVSIATLPAKNIKELVSLARRRPNELTYATVGKGSIAHLAAEMFNNAAGVKTVPVDYKGSAPALTALASGEVGFTVLNLLDPQPFVKQGKLRSLAVTSAKRSPALPDVPTMLESGINVEAYLYMGLFAPAATPAPIVNQLNTEITRIINEPQTNAWLVNTMGAEFSPHSPADYGEFLSRDVASWQKVIKQIGLRLD